MSTTLKNLSEYNESGIACRSELPTTAKIGIAVAEWNETITNSLANGAILTLKKYGFTDTDIVVKRVPGSFELPLAAKFFIDAGAAAVICLGCVVQGETRHFDFVSSGVTQGIMNISLTTGTPVAFGILTTNNLQQAIDRSGGKHGNKGTEAAVAVLKMLHLKINLKL